VQQSNNSDCGIFAIHFAGMFLKDPDFYSKSIKVTLASAKKLKHRLMPFRPPPLQVQTLFGVLRMSLFLEHGSGKKCWSGEENTCRIGFRNKNQSSHRLPAIASFPTWFSHIWLPHVCICFWFFFCFDLWLVIPPIDLTISGSFFVFTRAEIQKVLPPHHHDCKTQTKPQTRRGN
jgi:Ulp1 protease family, C-terminal catalytic domain